jgi:predicted Holliday junction resolvase-like endonuclease
MTLTDLLFPAIAFLLGIVAAYLFFRQQISAIEERARNDLERWKLECTSEIRKDSVNRSRSTLKGRISDQMAPLLPEFPFSPADARFIGNPIDFVVFDGYTKAKDEKGDAISVVLVEVKKGKGRLTRDANRLEPMEPTTGMIYFSRIVKNVGVFTSTFSADALNKYFLGMK